MSALICSIEKCQVKAIVRCRCKVPELLFCAEHLGNHLVNSPGKHKYEKLFDDPYLQTKHDVLSYIQNEIQNLNNSKTNIIKGVISVISNIENSLDNYLGRIDNNIHSLEQNLDEILQLLNNKNSNTNLEYLKLPSSEALTYFKENNKNLIDSFTYEAAISEIYKNLELVKRPEFQVISLKNFELELELQELRQSYEEIKAKEFEQRKAIDMYELSNKQLKINCEDLYKEKIDLELMYDQLIENNKNPEFQDLNFLPDADMFGLPYDQKIYFPNIINAPLGNPQTSVCDICKGRFANDEINMQECGCLSCRNCKIPPYTQKIGHKTCLVCNRVKFYGEPLWQNQPTKRFKKNPFYIVLKSLNSCILFKIILL